MAEAVKCVYMLLGNDAFLRDAHRDEIVRIATGDADAQTCVATFDDTAELADVLDELRTLPFLAPRRVVILRDGDAFVSTHRQKLEQYLQSPVETATLVLMLSSERRSSRLYKLVHKSGCIKDCTAPERSIGTWLTRSAGKRGKKITHDAAELLAQRTEVDLARLDSEIEKLALYVGDGDTITAEHVCDLATVAGGAAAFALSNALTDGNASDALKALAGMIKRPGDEFAALGSIAWHLRRALRAQQFAAAGKRPEGVLNPKMPYRAKDAFLAMLKRRPLGVLQSDFRRLIRADLGMKSGLGATAALQELVVSLCS